MKLFYFSGACALSPHIVLIELDLPYTLEKVDVATKKTAGGLDYLTINSKGAVPALQLDDGRVLTEGPAIVQYLADLKPDSGLAPRAGTFEPLRFVPKGKTVVLGLVSSKLPQLESGDVLARRIEEASKYVPLENLALSPQCGFASTMEGNLLTEDDQWAKLRLVADTARRVWNQ